MPVDLLIDALVDWVLSPVFDRLTGVLTAVVLAVGCVCFLALWWASGAVPTLVAAGLFGAAATVSLLRSRTGEED